MKKIIATLFITLMAPLAVIQADWDEGIDAAAFFNLPDPTDGPKGVLEGFLLWILGILAVLFALAFVISGVMFITSGGNQERTKEAKDYIKYSIIGLFVALSGYIIIKFISDSLGADL
jgi:hypothetical protein